jgi:hypothetical protein
MSAKAAIFKHNTHFVTEIGAKTFPSKFDYFFLPTHRREDSR